MRLYQLFENINEVAAHGKTVVIFPGRFQPFHRGHADTYRALQARFPGADVWIATSGKVGPDSPFSFEERKALAELMGIPGDRIVETASPYRAPEILNNYDPSRDNVIFALSKKDEERIGYGTKKDGTPSYMQPFEPNKSMQPFDLKNGHAYVITAPVVTFKVAGKSINSATDIRNMLTSGDAKLTSQVLKDMYGEQNFRAAAQIILKHFPINGKLVEKGPGFPMALDLLKRHLDAGQDPARSLKHASEKYRVDPDQLHDMFKKKHSQDVHGYHKAKYGHAASHLVA